MFGIGYGMAFASGLAVRPDDSVVVTYGSSNQVKKHTNAYIFDPKITPNFYFCYKLKGVNLKFNHNLVSRKHDCCICRGKPS